jgi:hypothetical protein
VVQQSFKLLHRVIQMVELVTLPGQFPKALPQSTFLQLVAVAVEEQAAVVAVAVAVLPSLQTFL